MRVTSTPSTVYAQSEGHRFEADRVLVVVSCATCHITYAIPESLQRSATKYPGDSANGWKLCCPMGHTWWYVGESVQAKLDRERQRSGRLSARLDQTDALLKAQKARASRFKNDRDRERTRIANGVCPCCNRTFKQLARHMKSQHPGFPPAGGDA